MKHSVSYAPCINYQLVVCSFWIAGLSESLGEDGVQIKCIVVIIVFSIHLTITDDVHKTCDFHSSQNEYKQNHILQGLEFIWSVIYSQYLGVSIGSLPSTKALDDIDVAPVVLHASLGTTSPLLFLLLFLNL